MWTKYDHILQRYVRLCVDEFIIISMVFARNACCCLIVSLQNVVVFFLLRSSNIKRLVN